MKIESLLIQNFRGIKKVEARELGETIIIAGQNGSGKSCIFDAIRLLKSTYGGYQQNEWQHFFGEFAIQLHGGAKNLKGLFNNSSLPAIIECKFKLRQDERTYIRENANSLLEAAIWQTLLPEAFQWGGHTQALFANQFRERQEEVTERVSKELPSFLDELQQPAIVGRIVINPDGAVQTKGSRLLSVVFTNYLPHKIGVIDFHGAQRHYGREVVQGINLSLDQVNQQYSQHTLYNYNNKYNNVKSEMAGNFVKELLAEKASVEYVSKAETLTDTLKKLFESFFPDKEFIGPRPTVDGGLTFPVRTQSGAEHDLDELSSGEKEILYGYLRIRSSAPKNSIILLDEPELHLNPRLIRGLPEFYRKYLGEALGNQLWLVTHSDSLIREAVGKPGFNVFHMLPCGTEIHEEGQLRPLTATQGFEMAVADLVGDLAAYRPGGKGLIFEGGGDSDFDKTLVSRLFSEELRGINLLSGSNKIRVKQLHEVLERAYKNGDLPTKFYAIVDRDSDGGGDEEKAINRFQWDVYHVENYLLEKKYIAAVVNDMGLTDKYTEESVLEKLKEAAEAVIPLVLSHRLRSYANSAILRAIDLRTSKLESAVGKELFRAASVSAERLSKLVACELTEQAMQDKETEINEEIKKSFESEEWLKVLPGREILKRFLSQERLSINYEIFRNMIIGNMARDGYKPVGMRSIIEKIARD